MKKARPVLMNLFMICVIIIDCCIIFQANLQSHMLSLPIEPFYRFYFGSMIFCAFWFFMGTAYYLAKSRLSPTQLYASLMPRAHNFAPRPAINHWHFIALNTMGSINFAVPMLKKYQTLSDAQLYGFIWYFPVYLVAVLAFLSSA